MIIYKVSFFKLECEREKKGKKGKKEGLFSSSASQTFWFTLQILSTPASFKHFCKRTSRPPNSTLTGFVRRVSEAENVRLFNPIGRRNPYIRIVQSLMNEQEA